MKSSAFLGSAALRASTTSASPAHAGSHSTSKNAAAAKPSGNIVALVASAGIAESLLPPENKDKLAAILTDHVLAGKTLTADVTTCQTPTVNGQKLPLLVAADKVTAGGANAVATTVAAGNGVIHPVDAVILPQRRIPASDTRPTFPRLLTSDQSGSIALVAAHARRPSGP